MATRARQHSSKDNGNVSVTGTPDMEYLWSVELNAESRTITWPRKIDLEDEDDDDFFNHKLYMQMSVLGPEAVPGEQNVVQLDSSNEEGEIVKAIISNLTRGENSMGTLSLTIDGKAGATLTLIEGTGPVHISGNHVLDYPKADPFDNSQTESEISEDEDVEDEENIEEDEEEEEEEEEEETKAAGKNAKRKGTPKSSKQKKAKVELEEDDEEEDVDYEAEDSEEEDSGNEKAKTKKRKESAKDAGKKEKAKIKVVAAKEPAKKVAKKGKK